MLKPGQQYYYCYLVDGDKKINPECPTAQNEDDQIVNFIIIPGRI